MPEPNDPLRRKTDADTPLLLLGIDGGGTKTTAVLSVHQADASPRTIGRGVSGPSNPRSAPWETARQNLDGAVRTAFAAAGRVRARVAALCLAVAGAGHESARAQLEQWCADQELALVWCVVHDARIILRAGMPQGPGIALIAGTGSLAYGRTPAGGEARAGGWGHLLGDEGSGYAIGLAALRAIACVTDGRGPDTRLAPRLLDQLGLSSPWDLIPALYEDPAARHRIAALAPQVLEVAGTGDTVAQQIQDRAARDLAAMVIAVARSLACADQGYHLVLSGGLLQHHAVLRDAVQRHLAAQQRAPQSQVVVEDPVHGAVLLANDLLAGLTPK